MELCSLCEDVIISGEEPPPSFVVAKYFRYKEQPFPEPAYIQIMDMWAHGVHDFESLNIDTTNKNTDIDMETVVMGGLRFYTSSETILIKAICYFCDSL